MLDITGIGRRLEELGRRFPESDPDMVADIVRVVLAAMRQDLTAHEASLLTEVESLAQTVASARLEIAALQAGDINASQIPSATDELDAIVAHTATATDCILEACERLDAVGLALDGPSAEIIQDVTTCIYQACGFQDITGQRITKVVATLQSIERKVAHIIDTFSPASAEPTQSLPPRAVTWRAEPVPYGDLALLNGPQLPGDAMNQSGIDALLASFD